MLDQEVFRKALLNMENFDWDFYFKYLESLVDPRKFHNIQKWLDKKGIKTRR